VRVCIIIITIQELPAGLALFILLLPPPAAGGEYFKLILGGNRERDKSRRRELEPRNFVKNIIRLLVILYGL
jgi:hypothetical protein